MEKAGESHRGPFDFLEHISAERAAVFLDCATESARKIFEARERDIMDHGNYPTSYGKTDPKRALHDLDFFDGLFGEYLFSESDRIGGATFQDILFSEPHLQSMLEYYGKHGIQERYYRSPLSKNAIYKKLESQIGIITLHTHELVGAITYPELVFYYLLSSPQPRYAFMHALYLYGKRVHNTVMFFDIIERMRKFAEVKDDHFFSIAMEHAIMSRYKHELEEVSREGGVQGAACCYNVYIDYTGFSPSNINSLNVGLLDRIAEMANDSGNSTEYLWFLEQVHLVIRARSSEMGENWAYQKSILVGIEKLVSRHLRQYIDSIEKMSRVAAVNGLCSVHKQMVKSGLLRNITTAFISSFIQETIRDATTEEIMEIRRIVRYDTELGEMLEKYLDRGDEK